MMVTDRGSSPMRVGRVDVGNGPGPGVHSPLKRSVRTGTDPGPVKCMTGRGTSPVRLGVDVATSPLSWEEVEVGTQTEVAGGSGVPVGPKPRRVRGRGVQTDPWPEEHCSSPAEEKRARPALTGLAGPLSYAEATAGGTCPAPGVVLRMRGAEPIRLSWCGGGDLTIEVPGAGVSPPSPGPEEVPVGGESPPDKKVGAPRRARRRAGRPSAVLPNAGPPRCYVCLEAGHTAAGCGGAVDRSGRCYRCGARSHKLRSCRAPPACPLCRDVGRPADHVLGGGGVLVSSSPGASSVEKRCGGSPNKPGRGRGAPSNKAERRGEQGVACGLPGSFPFEWG